MASYEKRGGYWRADVRVKGFPRVRESFDTKAEAIKWATLTERGLVEKRLTGEVDGLALAMKTTLATALDWYLEKITPGKKNESARNAEHSYVRKIKAHPISIRERGIIIPTLRA